MQRLSNSVVKLSKESVTALSSRLHHRNSAHILKHFVRRLYPPSTTTSADSKAHEIAGGCGGPVLKASSRSVPFHPQPQRGMGTLIRPPPNDPALSMMENTLELRRLSDIDPDLFTNKRPLWHPPGARGIYGGAVIAQCLSAAQHTVPEQFAIHSMHCYFVLAGNADIPVIYHVEHVREGRSFATRTVQAKQRGAVIFTTTLSFQKIGSAGKRTLDHDTALPDVPPPTEDETEAIRTGHGPFISQHLESVDSNHPGDVRTRAWMRAKGRISSGGGPRAHAVALAYMTDSFFIGTVGRAHKTWRSMPPPPRSDDDSQNESLRNRFRQMNGGQDSNVDNRPEIGMMVSMDHTVYFHRPMDFKADEWFLSTHNSPWAGDGRGLVTQTVHTASGKHVATCFQEGLARLKQAPENKL